MALSENLNCYLATVARVYKFALDDAETRGYSEIAAETTADGFGDLIP